jgi:outer membrane scaffolding protein for murein synthesis (MipA/OmpV family)
MKMKAIIFAILFGLCLPARASMIEYFKWEERSVGAMAFISPRYEGSNKYEPFYFPMMELQYGPLFASIMRGAGAYIPVNDSRSLIFAPALRWRAKRNLGESLGTIDFIKSIRPTATLNTIYKIDPFMLNFRITEGLANDNPGASYNIGATWRDDLLDKKLNLTLYTTLIWGDRAFNQTYFGITEREGERWGFPEWNAKGGLKSWDFGGLAKYFITKAWSVDIAFEYLRLVNVGAESPITFAKDQVLFGLGLSYRF